MDPILVLMITSQVKWSNYNFFSLAGSAGLASAPTTARKGPAERATDGQRRRKASDTVPSELMMSRTAVKNPVSVEIVIASVFGQISLSLRLSPARGRASGGGARGVNVAFAHGQK